jgi:thioesterase domain-containing protein
MPLPIELSRQLIEEQIAFVKRMGLKAEVLEPGYVRLKAPLDGNQNHIGSMYAGALFTLAELPGGALFVTSFDNPQLFPLLKAMSMRFLKPATGDIQVEARLTDSEIQHLQQQAMTQGKADYELNLQLIDAQGVVVAESQGLYQLRRR